MSEYSSGSTPPTIPGQLLVQMFITKEEEKALVISEYNSVGWRRQNNITDSDGLELGWTRKRSDTISTRAGHCQPYDRTLQMHNMVTITVLLVSQHIIGV